MYHLKEKPSFELSEALSIRKSIDRHARILNFSAKKEKERALTIFIFDERPRRSLCAEALAIYLCSFAACYVPLIFDSLILGLVDRVINSIPRHSWVKKGVVRFRDAFGERECPLIGTCSDSNSQLLVYTRALQQRKISAQCLLGTFWAVLETVAQKSGR